MPVLKRAVAPVSPPDAVMKAELKLAGSSRSSTAPNDPAETPRGIGRLGESTATPAVPAKDAAVQQ